jgi:riboflavin synthase
MFTGIVTDLGHVASFEEGPGGARIFVATSLGPELAAGESIAVNGCCLTVTSCDGQGFSADLSLETLSRTAFRQRGEGQLVNLERPLRLSDRLGGHLVQGHVDGLCNLIALAPEGDGHRLSVEIPHALRRYVVVKGSFALDGISLTVADYRDGQASVAVIPHTFQHTTLRERAPGDALHLEVDVLARYVEALNRAEEA